MYCTSHIYLRLNTKSKIIYLKIFHRNQKLKLSKTQFFISELNFRSKCRLFVAQVWCLLGPGRPGAPNIRGKRGLGAPNIRGKMGLGAPNIRCKRGLGAPNIRGKRGLGAPNIRGTWGGEERAPNNKVYGQGAQKWGVGGKQMSGVTLVTNVRSNFGNKRQE